jgi:hypothetical protein
MASERVRVADATTDADAVAKAHAIYTPTMLTFYDLVVHGLSNHLAWRCPTRRLLELYRANLSANHLEAGTGTGFFLDRADGAEFDRSFCSTSTRIVSIAPRDDLRVFDRATANPICLRGFLAISIASIAWG